MTVEAMTQKHDSNNGSNGNNSAGVGGLPGPKSASVVERDSAALSPSYTRSYPFVMDRGRGARVWDADGNEFLDMTTGIAVVATGHSHPRVVEAIKSQADRFVHMSGTDFFYEIEVELAERLAAIAPGDSDKRVFLTNSGTESVEAAIKLARWATGRYRFIAFTGAFHGRTMGSLALTASKSIQRARFGPLMPGVTHAPYPSPYRPPLGATAETAAEAVIDFIEHDLFGGPVPPRDVAAVFVEPVLGEGGYVVPTADFLPRLREMCDHYGILLVADEVQSGVGRTGEWWAVNHSGVVPDIVTSAKGIASGMPLGACIARADLMRWGPGSHGNTFGGNPIACAAAVATLEVIEDEGLLSNARRMGERFVQGLRALQSEHEAIGDVRGVGLMVAADLVTDRGTKEPATSLRDKVVELAYQHRLLLLGCGKSAVRFMPPLNVTSDEVDEALSKFEAALLDASGQNA